MSDTAVTWAKAQAVTDARGRPDANAKQMLVYVGSWADADGNAWVSVPTLAFETAKSERTVQRGLARLKALGLLLDTGRSHLRLGRLYPIYRLPLEDGPANTIRAMKAARGDTHVTPSEGAGCHPCHPTGDARVTPRGDTHVTQIGKEDSQVKHSGRARAGEAPGSAGAAAEPTADDRFEAVLAGWASKAPERASRPMALAAWAAVLDRTALSPERLAAAALRAVAKDPDFGRNRAMNLHRWLAEDRWEPWLAEVEAGPAAAERARAAAGMGPAPWGGPPEVREAVLAAMGPAGCASYLDPSGWREDGRMIVARTSFALDRLRRDAREALAALGVGVELRNRGETSGAA